MPPVRATDSLDPPMCRVGRVNRKTHVHAEQRRVHERERETLGVVRVLDVQAGRKLVGDHHRSVSQRRDSFGRTWKAGSLRCASPTAAHVDREGMSTIPHTPARGAGPRGSWPRRARRPAPRSESPPARETPPTARRYRTPQRLKPRHAAHRHHDHQALAAAAQPGKPPKGPRTSGAATTPWGPVRRAYSQVALADRRVAVTTSSP